MSLAQDRLKARPTTYKGIVMRSRLESTVAAFLDENGYDWEYEPQCFSNQSGQYLPDFRLNKEQVNIGDSPPRFGSIYLEVKGNEFDPDSVKKRMEIIWDSEPKALLMIWSPRYFQPNVRGFFPIGYPEGDPDENTGLRDESWWEDNAWLGICYRCASLSIYAMWGGWHCSNCGFYDGDCGFQDLEIAPTDYREPDQRLVTKSMVDDMCRVNGGRRGEGHLKSLLAAEPETATLLCNVTRATDFWSLDFYIFQHLVAARWRQPDQVAAYLMEHLPIEAKHRLAELATC